MTAFSAKTSAEAVITASRDEVWKVLSDPALVAQMTPFVKSITADGDHWIWSLSGLKVLGKGFSATFTERLEQREPEHIEFVHDPPEGETERAAVHGTYDLAEHELGTRLTTSLEICVDLPLPKVSGGAVKGAMKGVMATMGSRFSSNLLTHLDAKQVR